MKNQKSHPNEMVRQGQVLVIKDEETGVIADWLPFVQQESHEGHDAEFYANALRGMIISLLLSDKHNYEELFFPVDQCGEKFNYTFKLRDNNLIAERAILDELSQAGGFVVDDVFTARELVVNALLIAYEGEETVPFIVSVKPDGSSSYEGWAEWVKNGLTWEWDRIIGNVVVKDSGRYEVLEKVSKAYGLVPFFKHTINWNFTNSKPWCDEPEVKDSILDPMKIIIEKNKDHSQKFLERLQNIVHKN